MIFQMRMELGNAVFRPDDTYGEYEADGHPIAEYLRKVASLLEDGVQVGNYGVIRDTNGNRVGTWEVRHEPEGL